MPAKNKSDTVNCQLPIKLSKIVNCPLKANCDAQNLSINTSVSEPAINQEFEMGSDGLFIKFRSNLEPIAYIDEPHMPYIDFFQISKRKMAPVVLL